MRPGFPPHHQSPTEQLPLKLLARVHEARKPARSTRLQLDAFLMLVDV